MLIYILFPLIYIFSHYSWTGWDWDPLLHRVLTGAFIQAVLSTFLTLFFGTLGAFGLLACEPARKFSGSFRFVIFLALIPCLLPPLFVVLLSSKAVGFFPTGLGGVVFFHCLMNVGLSSLLLFKIMETKILRFYPLSLVNGVSSLKFIIRGLLPELRSDFLTLGFYFMLLYFFSFSVPLLVGGSRFGGVEVFIYEKIILLGQWNQALQYSLLLFLFLHILSFFIPDFHPSEISKTHGNRKLLSRLGHPLLLHIGLLPTWLVFLGFGRILLGGGWRTTLSLWPESIRGTLIMGFTTGIFIFVLLSMVGFSFLNKKFSKLFLTFINPGWVVVGFSFLLMGGEGVAAKFIKSSMALSVLYLPFLFRLSFQQTLQDLGDQVNISGLFPVSWCKIHKEVIFPQILSLVCFLSGLAALWACGDFALTGLVMNSDSVSTLALDIQALVNNYRLEQALVLLLPLMIVSFFVFFVFQGLFYVSNRKFLSSAQ